MEKLLIAPTAAAHALALTHSWARKWYRAVLANSITVGRVVVSLVVVWFRFRLRKNVKRNVSGASSQRDAAQYGWANFSNTHTSTSWSFCAVAMYFALIFFLCSQFYFLFFSSAYRRPLLLDLLRCFRHVIYSAIVACLLCILYLLLLLLVLLFCYLLTACAFATSVSPI